MDWDKLRIFHAVADAGSLTHAGDKLNLSQSALSIQIKNLEERLESIHGIWGDGAFDDIAVPVEEKDEYQALLHGPALPTEEHCSQEDIDALFD